MATINATTLLGFVLCFELSGILVFVLVLGEKNINAEKSAMHYLIVHLTIAGLILATTSIMQDAYINTNLRSLVLSDIKTSKAPGIILFFGILFSTAAFPISAWIIDAYSVLEYGSMILIASFSTKACLYVLYKLFHSLWFLQIIGFCTAWYGFLYSMLSRNMKKSALYAMIAQIGLLIIEIGMSSGTEAENRIFSIHILSSLSYQMIIFLASWYCSKENIKHGNYTALWAICLIIGLCSFASLPPTLGFYIKTTFYSKELSLQNNEYYLSNYLMQTLSIASIAFVFHYFSLFTVHFNRIFIRPKKYTDQMLPLIVMVILSVMCLPPFKMLNLLSDGMISWKMVFDIGLSKLVFKYTLFAILAFLLHKFVNFFVTRIECKDFPDTNWLYLELPKTVFSSIISLILDLYYIAKDIIKNLFKFFSRHYLSVHARLVMQRIQNLEFTLFIAVLFINIYIIISLLRG
ncbi:proton-conducting transporter membrane subunit [Candidatus Xenohaliotis californiensis]|uniref:proton-conducting transporter transmembrane domain-containing protein n=1 Tax=Candidatus Xenohaliotis californiensis TaxID=84677 RepID=UPI0030C84C82